MVDDDKPILIDSLLILEEVVPNAAVTGVSRPQEAIDYAKANRVDLAFLDIELGKSSGLDLCRFLIEINLCSKLVYLTAYPDYALDAWETGACGFMVKPLRISIRDLAKIQNFFLFFENYPGFCHVYERFAW